MSPPPPASTETGVTTATPLPPAKEGIRSRRALMGKLTGSLLIWFSISLFGYYALVLASTWLLPATIEAQSVWLADGFALGIFVAALRWAPYRLIPAAVLTGVLCANVFFFSGSPLGNISILIGATINTFQAFLAGILLHRIYRIATPLVVIRFALFLLIAVFGVNAITAALHAVQASVEVSEPVGTTFWTIFISDGLGIMLMTPLIATWTVRWRARDLDFLRRRTAEILLLLICLIASTWWAYARWPDAYGLTPPYFYFALPFIVWAVARFSSRGTTLALLIYVLMAVYYTSREQGPFMNGLMPVSTALLRLQEFLFIFMAAIYLADATLRDRTQALREKIDLERRYNAALRASDNLIFEIDQRSGQIIWAGDTIGVLGLSPVEIRSVHSWSRRIHPEDRDRVAGVRAQLASGALQMAVLEYRVLRHVDATNQQHYVTVGVNAFAHDTRLVDGISSERRIIGFIKNIGEKKEAEAEKIKLQAALHQAQKMEAIGQLAGGIAHDFNNILASILGYGEMARAKVENGSPIAKNIDAIVKAGERGRVLVSQILTFSRKSTNEKQIVDVADLTEEIVTLVRGSNPHTVQFTQRVARYGALVHGNATELHQLIMNLATNGLQSMTREGKLEIEIELRDLRDQTEPKTVLQGQLQPGRYVVIVVRDYGTGVDAATRERMFEPFFTTKPAGQGTGLGLSLAMSIAKAHDGGIDLESEMGEGCTFTVYLPAVGEDEREQSQQFDDLPRGNDECILLVDDEAPLRNLAAEMLASLGYQSASYATSEEAFAAFERQPDRFDAVLSDEVMPNLSGTQLAARIQAIAPHIPVVIITGYGGPGFELRAQNAGVVQVLKKPYEKRLLAMTLADVLARRDRQDE
jgi:signal transduction histidine kinase/ActR/RegA family two-component response regulator